MTQVWGTIFVQGGELGSYGWMLAQPQFQNSLFIFNDNVEDFISQSCLNGGGNAVIRDQQCLHPPRASGVPTGSIPLGGFSSLSQIQSVGTNTKSAKELIDDSIKKIKDLLLDGNYNYVFYASNSNGQLGTGIFSVSSDVINYITSQIQSLGEYKGVLTNMSQLITTLPPVTPLPSPVPPKPIPPATNPPKKQPIEPELPVNDNVPGSSSKSLWFIFGIGMILLLIIIFVIYNKNKFRIFI